MRWLVPIVLAACYSPASFQHCEVSCASGVCPAGLTCGSDRMCHDPDRAICSQSLPDAATPALDCFGIENTLPFVDFCIPASLDVPTTYEVPMTVSTETSCDFRIPQGTGLPELCAIVADDLTVGEPGIRPFGSRPLVLVARQTLTIRAGATLDLAGRNTDVDDPSFAYVAGSNACMTLPGQNSNTTQGAGGGPGGSFGGTGGAGAPATAGGTSAPSPGGGILHIRGGCRGGFGGNADATLGGRGGNSGGAVYLAASRIVVEGSINASGGGARSAGARCGGGGGGTGGMVVMWAAAPITIGTNAQIFALGGGGSSGGGQTGAGVVGNDPKGPGLPAMNAGGSDGGGHGGAGSTKTLDDGVTGGIGQTLDPGGGGGGGGGSSGWIAIHPPVTSSAIAPPPSAEP